MDAVSTLLNPFGTAGQSQDTLRARVIALLDRSVFRGILVVLLLTAIPYGTVQPWWVALFECCVFALTAFWAVQGALAQRWGLPNKMLLAPPAALLLFAFIQTLPLTGISLSNDSYQTRLWILQFGALLLTAAILLRYTSTVRRLSSLVTVVIVIGALSAIFGLVRQALNVDLPIHGLLDKTIHASYAQFINRNHFALLMEMSFGLAAAIVVAGGIRRAYLIALLLLIGIFWVALVFSNSRGGVLAMLGQSLMLGLFWKRSRGQHLNLDPRKTRRAGHLRRLLISTTGRVVLTACLVATIGLGVVWLGGESLRHRWEILPRELKTENAARDNSSRLAIWKATLLMIRDHPIAGVGLGGYRVSLPRYHDASGGWVPQEAHNEYLELMASSGIIGFALMVIFIVTVIKLSTRCLRTAADPFRRAACFGAQIGLFGVAIHSFVDFGLHVTVNALVCVALIVIATRTIPLSYDTSVASNLAT